MKRVVAVSVLMLSAGGAACSRSNVHAAAGAEIPSVAAAPVTRADLSQVLTIAAEFRPYQEIDVHAKVAGYLQKIPVDVGDHVKEGTLLALLEVPELQDEMKQDRASIDRAAQEVKRAEADLARAESAHQIAHVSSERLVAAGKERPKLIAQQDLDDAASRDQQAEAQVATAKASIAAAQGQLAFANANADKTQTLVGYTRITAPFTGVITRRYADKGSMIQAGTASQSQAMPLVKLSENTLLRLILPVPESAVPTVHIGQQVEVRVPTMNRSFPGKVERFSDKLSLSTRTMDTEVDVPNPSLLLIPGMYAEVNLTLNQRKAVVAVPMTAVDSQGGRTGQVMVVTPDQRVEVRKIELGLETADKVEVRSGLRVGDLVVIGGRASLQPGEEVRPKVVTMTASQP